MVLIIRQLWQNKSIELYVSKCNSVSCDSFGFHEISVWLTDTIPIVPKQDWGINSKFISLSGIDLKWSNSSERKLVSGHFKAYGGERFLIVGNFKGANLEITQKCKSLYYYFDDISVTESKDYLKDKDFSKSIELKDIIFKTGNWQLLPSSLPTLNQLVLSLQKNPALGIEIRGYTDNVGNETANLYLSEQRAKAVLEYLIDQGIEPERLTYAGFGNANPIASNETAIGRQLNRRVEFVIFHKE